jgi:hypothetical protein
MMKLCIVILRRMSYLSPTISFLVWKAVVLKTVSDYVECEIFSLIPLGIDASRSSFRICNVSRRLTAIFLGITIAAAVLQGP